MAAVLPWQRDAVSRVIDARPSLCAPRFARGGDGGRVQRRDFDVHPFPLDARNGDGCRAGLRADGDRGAGCRSEKRKIKKGRRGERQGPDRQRSEEHTSELQSLMRISYAVFCLKKKNKKKKRNKKRSTENQKRT